METIDPAAEIIEMRLLHHQRILRHRLAPEIEAKLDLIVAEREAAEQQRLSSPLYVCIPCGYLFREGRPDKCPRCHTTYRKEEQWTMSSGKGSKQGSLLP